MKIEVTQADVAEARRLLGPYHPHGWNPVDIVARLVAERRILTQNQKEAKA